MTQQERDDVLSLVRVLLDMHGRLSETQFHIKAGPILRAAQMLLSSDASSW